MLTSLRHYLEHHAGAPRQVAWPRIKVAVPRGKLYQELTGPQGLFDDGVPAKFREGDHYSAHTAAGDTLSGRVEFIRPSRGFCVTIENMNNALLWLTIEGAKQPHEVGLWLSAYELPQPQVDAFGDRWNAALQKLFPGSAAAI